MERHMGTIGDWGLILVMGVFGGLYGWLRDIGHRPYINKLRRSLAGWILFCSVVGIWCTFRWQAITVPLVFITVPAAVAAVILIYFARPRGDQKAAAQSEANSHK
jgi:hypothetical protein